MDRMEGQIDGWMEGRWINRCIDGWIGWMEGQIDGWMEGQMDK